MSGLMFRLSEYCCSMRRNLFTTLLMTLMAVMLLVCGSLVIREWKKYAPYAELNGKQGLVYFYAHEYGKSEPSFAGYDVTEYNVQRLNATAADETLEQYQFTTCVYPDWVMDNWSPRLQSGRWIDEDSDDNEIVISKNPDGITTGDSITLCCFDKDTDEEINVTFKVVGVLADGTQVLNGQDSYNSDREGYNICYTSATSGYNMQILMSENITEKYNLWTSTSMVRIVVFNEEISEEKFDSLYDEIKNNTSSNVFSLDEFAADCRGLIMDQISTYVPILIFGIILVLTGVYAAAHINLKMGMKHHTIFLLVGATPLQRLGVSLMDVLVNVLLSILVFAAVVLGINGTSLRGQLVVEYSTELWILVVIYYLINIAFSVLFYVLAWRNISPKQALLENR